MGSGDSSGSSSYGTQYLFQSENTQWAVETVLLPQKTAPLPDSCRKIPNGEWRQYFSLKRLPHFRIRVGKYPMGSGDPLEDFEIIRHLTESENTQWGVETCARSNTCISCGNQQSENTQWGVETKPGKGDRGGWASVGKYPMGSGDSRRFSTSASRRRSRRKIPNGEWRPTSSGEILREVMVVGKYLMRSGGVRVVVG